jgi:hypothetical protein
MLPATAVTEQMRQEMIAIAEESARSLAEVQREAFQIFLLSAARKSNISDRNPNIQEDIPF